MIRKFLLAVLPILVAACNDYGEFLSTGKTVLVAEIAGTRTVLDDTKVYWTNGDRINVNGYDSDPLYFDAGYSESASFVVNADLAGPLYAVYPSFIYKDVHTVTLPQEQMYDGDSFGPDASPMLAYQTEGNKLTFAHPCAVLQFSLTKETDTHNIRYVEFRGNNAEQVCGDFTVDYENCKLIPAGGGQTIRVYLNKKGNVDVSIVIPAGEYSKGYTVKVVDKEGHFMELSTSARIVEKGTVYTMPAKEFVPTGTMMEGDSQPLRILGIGNSWTRDSMRYLSALLKYSDRKIIVGHGYLGGSTLHDQYMGIDDEEYTYVHSGKNQVVHDTYQYWKYDGTTNPTKTPSDDAGYNNGLGGIGVTLESVVKDEPWDIIVFQPHVLVCLHMPSATNDFDINDLVARVKQMMDPEVAAKVRCGLMAPWTYAEGSEDKRQANIDAYNGGVWPADQNEWDAHFERVHGYIQEDIKKLAQHMGENCEFIINVGQAMYNARRNPVLSQFGYKLQRAKNDTHLGEGVPMMLASLCYAYELAGLSLGESTFYPSTSAVMTENGKETITTTAEHAREAQIEAWRVHNNQ